MKKLLRVSLPIVVALIVLIAGYFIFAFGRSMCYYDVDRNTCYGRYNALWLAVNTVPPAILAYGFVWFIMQRIFNGKNKK